MYKVINITFPLTILHLVIYLWVCGSWATTSVEVRVWRVEVSSPFSYVGVGNQTQVFRVGGEYLSQPSHLSSSFFFLFISGLYYAS